MPCSLCSNADDAFQFVKILSSKNVISSSKSLGNMHAPIFYPSKYVYSSQQIDALRTI